MSGDHNMHQKPIAPTEQRYEQWLTSPLTKALKQSHQNEIDAIVKDADKAYELLHRAETEMRYAGWKKRLSDNPGRADVYEAIKEFLK